MNGLKPRATFQVLVMSRRIPPRPRSDRDGLRAEATRHRGVRVFFYLEDRERTLDSPTDKIMLSLTAFADELEREKARQRTYDAMLRKARAGHVTGGRVFGYANVEILGASGKRSHVERRINDDGGRDRAAHFHDVRRGTGAPHDRESAERRSRAGTAGAARPAVRVGLDIDSRSAVSRSLPRRDRLEQDAEAEQLGPRATQREGGNRLDHASRRRSSVSSQTRSGSPRTAGSSTTRQTYLRGTHGQLWGRPVDGHESKYLLTGLSRCGVCGGTLIVRSRDHGHRRAYFYACSSFHHRGKTVCAELDGDAPGGCGAGRVDGARARAARPGDPRGRDGASGGARGGTAGGRRDAAAHARDRAHARRDSSVASHSRPLPRADRSRRCCKRFAIRNAATTGFAPSSRTSTGRG